MRVYATNPLVQQGFRLDRRCLTGRTFCVSMDQNKMAWVVDGKVQMTENYALEPDELEAGYVLTCQSVPVIYAVTSASLIMLALTSLHSTLYRELL